MWNSDTQMTREERRRPLFKGHMAARNKKCKEIRRGMVGKLLCSYNEDRRSAGGGGSKKCPEVAVVKVNDLVKLLNVLSVCGVCTVSEKRGRSPPPPEILCLKY